MKTALQQCIDKIKLRQTQVDGMPNAYSELKFALDTLTKFLPVEQDQIESAFLTGGDEWTGNKRLDVAASKDYYIDNFITPNIEKPSA